MFNSLNHSHISSAPCSFPFAALVCQLIVCHFFKSLHSAGSCDVDTFQGRDVELSAALNYPKIISDLLLPVCNKLTAELSGWVEC